MKELVRCVVSDPRVIDVRTASLMPHSSAELGPRSTSLDAQSFSAAPDATLATASAAQTPHSIYHGKKRRAESTTLPRRPSHVGSARKRKRVAFTKQCRAERAAENSLQRKASTATRRAPHAIRKEPSAIKNRRTRKSTIRETQPSTPRVAGTTPPCRCREKEHTNWSRIRTAKRELVWQCTVCDARWLWPQHAPQVVDNPFHTRTQAFLETKSTIAH